MRFKISLLYILAAIGRRDIPRLFVAKERSPFFGTGIILDFRQIVGQDLFIKQKLQSFNNSE